MRSENSVCAWQAGRTLEIRRTQAIRLWQHVLEPLVGYLILAEKLWQQPELAGACNFGLMPMRPPRCARWWSWPVQPCSGDVVYGDGAQSPHEAGRLALEIARAQAVLGVAPKWGLAEAVNRTMAWYRAQHEGVDARALCEAEIAA